MSKVKLITEISKSTYDTIMAKSVLTPNEAAKAIDAILNSATLTECDDCVSRQEAIHCVTETELYNETFAEAKMRIAELKPVLPKREQGEWVGDKAYPICPKCNCNIIEEYISCSDYAEMYKPMKYCPNCGAEMR